MLLKWFAEGQDKICETLKSQTKKFQTDKPVPAAHEEIVALLKRKRKSSKKRIRQQKSNVTKYYKFTIQLILSTKNNAVSKKRGLNIVPFFTFGNVT